MLEKERKTMRARSGEDAKRIWDRFAPTKRRQGQLPPMSRQPQQGRQMPSMDLIRGKR